MIYEILPEFCSFYYSIAHALVIYRINKPVEIHKAKPSMKTIPIKSAFSKKDWVPKTSEVPITNAF